MEFKGTKGEWEYSSDNSWECSVVTDNERQTITLENTDSESDNGFYEMYHNAKLIAAAPELLEALYELISLKKWKDEFGKDEWYLEKQPLAWSNAQKVLEKALT